MEQKFDRSFAELENIVAMTEAVFDQAGLDSQLRNVVDLAVEELFVNMVNYNTETEHQILLEMEARENAIDVSLTDFDVERFDPTMAGQANVDAPLDERTPGGLGLFLVLKMVDSIQYQYKDRQSKITFRVEGK